MFLCVEQLMTPIKDAQTVIIGAGSLSFIATVVLWCICIYHIHIVIYQPVEPVKTFATTTDIYHQNRDK